MSKVSPPSRLNVDNLCVVTHIPPKVVNSRETRVKNVNCSQCDASIIATLRRVRNYGALVTGESALQIARLVGFRKSANVFFLLYLTEICAVKKAHMHECFKPIY